YKGKKLFIITDSNIEKLYASKIPTFFEGYEYTIHIIEAGEKNKHLETVKDIYTSMIEDGVTRDDLVVAFGGGVVGDIAGFVAATYLRGVKFIQIPTTVVSQVDSSVGGKVGVDLPAGKNLVGAFYQPKLVLIDIAFLRTLETRYFFDGFAEIVKYGCIYDKELFSKLENIVKEDHLRKNLMDNMEDIVYRSCEIKKEVVEKDEKESNLRMILNFGHTIGHAIEQYYNFEKHSHGEAVSIGMIDIVNIGEKLGITKKDEIIRIQKLLERLKLPITDDYPIDKITNIMKRDKKSKSDGISFIFLKEIGKVEIIKMSSEEVMENRK
ncbi:MAG: 3-dehydroquinate synthase, partial [Leptotrichiaceae bacterium]